MIPYYPVALIGVPFSSIGWTSDLCAIPHELGHVVYHASENVKDSAGRGIVTERVQTQRLPRGGRYPVVPNGPEISSNWYDPWLEEIFADVYGCIVAGPYIAHHFINLSKGWKGSELVANPGSHPSPLIRPYVYIEALKKLDSLFPGLNLSSGAIANLTATWNTFVSRHDEVQLADGAKWSANAAAAAIEEAVDDIFSTRVFPALSHLSLNPQANGTSDIAPWPDRSTWSSVTNDVMPDIVVTTANSVPSDELPKTLTPATAQQLIKGWLPNVIAGVLPASEWRKMLSFGGWLDKGPEGGKAH
jgi:hypothetical protein